MALVAVTLAVVASVLPPTAAGPVLLSSSPPAGRVGWINISATGSYGYTPPYLEQVPTNATITVTFTDKSDMAHSFTIIGKEGWVVPTSYSPAQIDQLAYGNSPPNLVDSNVTGPGDVNVTTFVSPGPGWYEFICTVSGHFQLGMYGFVAFGMNLPSNLTGNNRTGVGGGLTFSWEDAVIIAVIVVAAVAGYVVLDRRQKRERMR
jgi:plastocyanin